MGELFGFIWCAIAGLFRSRAALQAEILVLRHQLNILRRRSAKRVALGNIDRLVALHTDYDSLSMGQRISDWRG